MTDDTGPRFAVGDPVSLKEDPSSYGQIVEIEPYGDGEWLCHVDFGGPGLDGVEQSHLTIPTPEYFDTAKPVPITMDIHKVFRTNTPLTGIDIDWGDERGGVVLLTGQLNSAENGVYWHDTTTRELARFAVASPVDRARDLVTRLAELVGQIDTDYWSSMLSGHQVADLQEIVRELAAVLKTA